METVGFAWFFIGIIIGLVIWFYFNRASVRANRQVELLESIDNKLSKLLDPSFEEIKKICLQSNILMRPERKQASDLFYKYR